MKTRPGLTPRIAGLAAALVAAPLIGLRGQSSCVSHQARLRPAAYAAAVARARAIVCDQLAGKIPGLQVAVAVGGKLVWSEAFGYADVAREVPVTAETQFRIGSVSKPLTAAAVALLYEQGKLDLDAPVQRYVPSFPDKGYPITTRQLAGHLAGIRHYRGDEFLRNRHFDTVLEGLAIFQGDSLLFPPGTKFSYSSYGWNLISAVVEGAAGQDFLTYMSRNVLRPLGLTHTAPDRVDQPHPQPNALLRARGRQRVRSRAARGQQLQVGRRRLSLHGRRPREVRLGAARARVSQSSNARAAVHLTEDHRGRADWLWHRLVRRHRRARPPLGLPRRWLGRRDDRLQRRPRLPRRRRDHVESDRRAAPGGRGDSSRVRSLAPGLLPLPRVEQNRSERDVGLDLGIFLEPLLMAVHQERHLG